MSLDVKEVNKLFKKVYGELFDMMLDPNRQEEYKEYCRKRDERIEVERRLEDERNKKICKLSKLEKGMYEVKLLKDIYFYTSLIGKTGDIVKVYNNGNTWTGGSMNRHQDDRALIFDYGMSGTDNYYPTIDFVIINYLGNNKGDKAWQR